MVNGKYRIVRHEEIGSGYRYLVFEAPEMAAQLVKYRLSLLAGEWWETPEAGFFIPEQMREGRITEADAGALSSAVTA